MINKFFVLAAVLLAVSVQAQPWGLKVVVFDVGQGDAILVMAPNGDVALIDAGRKIDHGKRVAEYLQDAALSGVASISNVKVAMSTHYDADHIGGFPGLARSGITFSAIYDQGPSGARTLTGSSGRLTTYGKYIAITGDADGDGQPGLGENRFVRHKAEFGDTLLLGEHGEITLRVVSVRGDTKGDAHDLDLDPSAAGPRFNENPGSIAVVIRYGEFEMYTAGDQTDDDWKHEPAVEQQLVAAGAIIGGNDIDVLKVSHHGSDTSTSDGLANALAPEVAIISTKFGRDRLPKKTTLKQLTEAGSLVLITGDGKNAEGRFADSTSAEDDGWFSAGKPIFNDQGDISVVVSSDGTQYRVVGDSFDRSFSAID